MGAAEMDYFGEMTHKVVRDDRRTASLLGVVMVGLDEGVKKARSRAR